MTALGINAETTPLGVIGLGYIGLPLALAFFERGFAVTGFDVDDRKTDALARGEGYLPHLDANRIATLKGHPRFSATTDFTRLKTCRVVVICVPTPLTAQREPDLSFVTATAREVGRNLSPGGLVVLESTTYPGTTRTLLTPILEEESGLTAGRDFFVAFAPERVDPGNRDFDVADIPKVVGGICPQSSAMARDLYACICPSVTVVSSSETAEMTKLLENVFRAVNIALVNEMKLLAHRMDLDIAEIVEAAATKPFGFMPFQPGPGLGGHCLPIDPFYLTWKAREYGLSTRFIELAGEINTAMPDYVVSRLQQALNEEEKSLKGSSVLVMGLAYKPDVADLRQSPSLKIIDRLLKAGCKVDYHDPLVERIPRTRKYDLNLASVSYSAEMLECYDAVVLATDHSCYRVEELVAHARLVVDPRNACRHVRGGKAKVIPA